MNERTAVYVELFGEYDLSRKAEVEEILGTVPAESDAVVDLRAVTYVDSTFLQALATLRKRLPDSRITLSGANEHLKRILTLMSFDKMFEIGDCVGVATPDRRSSYKFE